ncbi:MAG: carboxypeptidase-like regulatory domain-containing protein [Acidobacteriaceae bacterium]
MDKSYPFAGLRALVFAVFLVEAASFGLQAQSVSVPQTSRASLPDAPAQSAPNDQPLGSIHGTVMDTAGDVVPGATVTLIAVSEAVSRTVQTNGAGFFTFSGVGPGQFHLAIAAVGFAPWSGPEIVLSEGQSYETPQIALQIAASNTSVRVVFSSPELAEQQMHVEEKQRVVGLVPNFYTSYVWDAEPLTVKQKFHLAWRSSIDPVTFLGAGVVAGIQQWDDDFNGYGQGAQGYAKRFGAAYADGFSGVMLGGAVFPALLHQDPRYFYKGTGSIRSRALYAISTVVICKGDNGRWQPNYSSVLGTFSAAGISNFYYPPENRGFQLTIDNALIGTASGAVGALLQEFVIKKISTGVPAQSSSPQP